MGNKCEKINLMTRVLLICKKIDELHLLTIIFFIQYILVPNVICGTKIKKHINERVAV